MLSLTKIVVGQNLFDFLPSHFSLLESHSPSGEVGSREIEAVGVGYSSRHKNVDLLLRESKSSILAVKTRERQLTLVSVILVKNRCGCYPRDGKLKPCFSNFMF